MTTRSLLTTRGGMARLWFPSCPTGSTWNVSVECLNAAPQFSQLVW